MRIDNGSAYDNNKNAKKKWDFRYTMGVIICVLVVAVGAVALFGNGVLWDRDGNEAKVDRPPGHDLMDGGGIDVVNPVPTVDSKDNPKSEGSETKQQDGKTAKSPYIMPVEGGSIVKEFSGSGLVYSKTLDQYAMHEGVDIEAKVDTPVKAIAEGLVTKVYQDDTMGVTIEINHGDGLTARYCNLSTDEMVEEGDAVKAGDVISGIGTSSLFESLDPPHLHLEIWKEGQAVDPVSFIQ